MGYRLGIDVGGTFTDLVLFSEEAGTLVVEKVSSVPEDPPEHADNAATRRNETKVRIAHPLSLPPTRWRERAGPGFARST